MNANYEQLRQAARDAAQEAVKGFGVGVDKAADAASDVWEAAWPKGTVDDEWAEGRGRCPYCIDDDETFHAFCDCAYHDKTCDIEGCMGK